MSTEDTLEKIAGLKEEKNAVILAHNYQPGEIQDAADFLGDSLDLSLKAAETDADVIVFCGVKFMAETAAILSPQKTVLMPDETAGCPLAEMITVPKLKALQKKHPGAKTVAYVNTNADVKAEVDVCCTSANAVNVVKSIDSDEIIFVPDKYLGNYVSTQTDKKLILWNGFCPTHVRILAEEVKKQKKRHPDAEVMAHPECTPDVIEISDHVFSTGGMVKYARESDVNEFIVGTEVGMLYRLGKENPGKKFYPASELAVCPNMKKTTLDKLLWALKENKHVVSVQRDVSGRARKSIQRMIEIF